MSRGTIQHRAAVFLAALQLALSLGLPLDLVLCSTARGHVAIESAVGDDCCPGHDDSATDRRSTSDPDCDGCTDTRISRTLLQRDASAAAHLVAPAHVLIVALPPTDSGFAARAGEPSGSGNAPAPPIALSTRRSVVLVV
ncbi:MAG TPA: hypothetical protein VGR62_16355 [Candidatus Binatia bacterium]|jgi:hypothetical protein|nr:hypothetical protein [Candidatus Binatia bacterium]